MNAKPPVTDADQSDAQKNEAARKWFLKWIFGFFLTFIIVDMIFLYLASRSHSGVIVEKSYEIGKNYNEIVERARAQEKLGWRSDMHFSKENGLVFSLRNDKGEALTGAQVSAEFIRPIKSGSDFSADLIEIADGTYGVPVTMPVNGQWIIKVKARWNDQDYQISKRLVVE